MGFVAVICDCASCHRMIHCNPIHVPSIRINNEGPRRPICRDCADYMNGLLEAKGIERVPIHDEAYLAADEDEVTWQ